MSVLLVITHPEVTVDPDIPVVDWPLHEQGRHRARTFAASDAMADVSQIWTSAERKARETAAILAATRALPVDCDAALGENDRSATGYLPKNKFEAAADAFFAQPDHSFCGWETARDAQARIRGAVSRIVATHDGADLAIVTHGAVGTLLWCALSHRPIDRQFDQPFQGHFWHADLATLRPRTGWRAIG
ncbi:phosphoglycerate mutase family protein [Ruegeria lacuscaerulensis ITI-1157]|nr:phosphoglycerate mutase family protein [Ruegeria lacuscaerulensis ITI-1157]SHI98975.1 Broad specificity phosphatase PhoE [Ruegeria lacuscaerulensis ITI-1157]